MLNFDVAPEFEKDVKNLKKKWRSIPNDIENVKRAIVPLYVSIDGVDMKEFRDAFFGTNRATILLSNDNCEVVKMRLDCAALGNDKKTRLVFVAIIAENTVKFIELYAKNGNEREDVRRLRRYLP